MICNRSVEGPCGPRVQRVPLTSAMRSTGTTPPATLRAELAQHSQLARARPDLAASTAR
jgi:hypothetical protein